MNSDRAQIMLNLNQSSGNSMPWKGRENYKICHNSGWPLTIQWPWNWRVQQIIIGKCDYRSEIRRRRRRRRINFRRPPRKAPSSDAGNPSASSWAVWDYCTCQEWPQEHATYIGIKMITKKGLKMIKKDLTWNPLSVSSLCSSAQ